MKYIYEFGFILNTFNILTIQLSLLLNMFLIIHLNMLLTMFLGILSMQLALCICRLLQKITLEHVQTLFLLLFPMQYSTLATYTTFALY